MKKKRKTRRISVTLPSDLYEDFVERSHLSGLSISRIAYLQLKNRKQIMVVPASVLQILAELKEKLMTLEAEVPLSKNDIANLRYSLRLIHDNVDAYCNILMIPGGKKHEKH